MTNLEEKLYQIKIESGKTSGWILEEMLAALDFFPTTWEDADKDYICHNLYFETSNEANEKNMEFKEYFTENREIWGVGDDVEISVNELKKEDWAEVWKQFFHPKKVSDRFVIKPSWEDYEPQENEVILEIDPGMTFGTGQHGTTQACLQFIDFLAQKEKINSLLDAGTGSGILALGAAKLGIKKIDAFDYDPMAVKIAQENLELAKVANNVTLQVADIYRWKSQQPYDVVIANILCVVLLDVVDVLKGSVRENGYLILAGILDDQYEHLRKTYEDAGFKQLQKVQLNEWTSGLFQKV